MKTYTVEYCVFFTDGSNEEHTIRIKNCMSELHAKIRLEDYLKRKHNNFKSVNIFDCYPSWSDIFGVNFPF